MPSHLPPMSAGLIGYLGYESIIWKEKIPIYENDTLQCPDAVFMLFHELIAFDHLKNQINLIKNGRDRRVRKSVLTSKT